ncbi:MAG: thioredoxin-like domain-containing protein [Prevotella sp.]|nr:thioredoxin-like domain-containing protein [Prevotella sp.]
MKVTNILGIAMLCLSLHAEAADLDSLYAKSLLPVGTEAPMLNVSELSDYALANTKGHYTVLDFWASWCGDCRRDLPEMKKLVKQYQGDSISFVGVSFDTDKARLDSFCKAQDIGWQRFSELKKWKDTEVSKQFGVSWIPTYYVLDADRRVLLATVDIHKLKACLERLDLSKVVVNWGAGMHFSDPEYTGGKNALGRFLADNIRFPELAMELNATAKVRVNFHLDPSGRIDSIGEVTCKNLQMQPGKRLPDELRYQLEHNREALQREVARLFCAEATRIVRLQRDWKAPRINGKPYGFWMVLPVTFRI